MASLYRTEVSGFSLLQILMVGTLLDIFSNLEQSRMPVMKIRGKRSNWRKEKDTVAPQVAKRSCRSPRPKMSILADNAFFVSLYVCQLRWFQLVPWQMA